MRNKLGEEHGHDCDAAHGEEQYHDQSNGTVGLFTGTFLIKRKKRRARQTTRVGKEFDPEQDPNRTEEV